MGKDDCVLQKVSEIVKLIEADGWYLARTRGSHRQRPTSNEARHDDGCR